MRAGSSELALTRQEWTGTVSFLLYHFSRFVHVNLHMYCCGGIQPVHTAVLHVW